MKWEDPPPQQPKHDNTPPDWVPKLMAHPKRWALVMENLTGSSANYYQREINLNLWHRLPPGTKWEATRRPMGNDKFGVWARFIR